MKITSGTFLAISSALLAFMGSIKENPILGQILEMPFAGAGLLATWCCSGILFAFAWIRERQAEADAEFLMSEDGLAEIIRQLRFAHLKPLSSGHLAFSRKHLVDIISPPRRYRPRVISLLSPGLGHSAAEAIASSQIERLLARGIISRAPIKGVQEWFQIDEELIASELQRFE